MGKNLYTDARECVIKNGFFTEYWACMLTGDRILPYIFDICEVMIDIMRQNRNFRS